jgi:hypothetical protein
MREIMSAGEGKMCNFATCTSPKLGDLLRKEQRRKADEQNITNPNALEKEESSQSAGTHHHGERDQTLGRTLRRWR